MEKERKQEIRKNNKEKPNGRKSPELLQCFSSERSLRLFTPQVTNKMKYVYTHKT